MEDKAMINELLAKGKASNKNEMILVELAPRDIDFFNKLLEGYDNLALVTTIDAQLGKMALWVTEHTKKDALRVLKCLPIPVRFISEN